MKQIKIISLLVIFISMAGIKTYAYDIEVENTDGVTIYYNWINDKTELAVTSCVSTENSYANEYTGNVVIPDSVNYDSNTYSVTCIDDKAFSKNTLLKSVTIPNSVINIGNIAFYGCTGLTSITIPNSVTTIGNSAFSGCTGLTSVTIPNNVTSIGSYAFSGCTGLTSVTIPNSVTAIGSYMFRDCTGLVSITIPNSVASIGGSAFQGCTRLTSVTIPNSVASIGDSAFQGCTRLTSVTIPNSIIAIGEKAFYNTYLKSVIIGSGVLTIGRYAFSYSSYNGSRPVKVIWLTNTPPDGYANAEGTVNYVANDLYNNLSDTKVYPFLSSLFEMEGIKCVPVSPSERTCDVIDCTYSYSNEYTGNTVIPESVNYDGNTYSVTCICDKSFYNNTLLKSVTIPNSVTNIGNEAFSGCTGLTSVTIPNSIIAIGEKAFYNTKLKSVTIGTGVLSIGNDAFSYPVKVIWLTNTPPDGYANAEGTVNYVANDLYKNLSDTKVYPFLSSIFEVDGIKYVPVSPSDRTCDAIDCAYDETTEKINIGKTVSYKGVQMTVKNVKDYTCYDNSFIKDVDLSFDGNLGGRAFQGCTNISIASIQNTGDIGQYVFGDCTQLETINIQNQGVIGNRAFSGCSALKTATLGEGVTSIGQNVFENCEQLQSVVIPDAVTSIGSRAFSGCSSITSIKMGKGVETINKYAFSRCSSLSEMQIGSKVKTICNYAFSNCSSLPAIQIPQSVTDIQNYAFSGCQSLKTIIMDDQETELKLGSNGSNPLFSDCPLDSVYIGRNISYSTSSSYGYSPFYRNTTLRSVTITDKETEISQNEFYGCTNLKNVSIGDGVTTIGDWAFSGCSNLDYFAFGSSVETIGKEAFSDCTAMTRLISRAATPPACGSQALDDINKWNCTLSVPIGTTETYQQAEQWKEFFFIEESTGIKGIKIDAATINHYYTLDGQRMSKPKKGVNIIRQSNGKSYKIIVK